MINFQARPSTLLLISVLCAHASAQNSPSFTLTLASPTITLAQGAGIADVLTVNPANGFSGAVSLTATGVPAGVGNTFYPANPTSTNTNFVLYVNSTVTPGSYSVALNGVSGSLTASAALTLVVMGTQTITFPAITAQTAGTTAALGATASSGLTVTYASTTPAVCTVSGSTANLLAAGTCSITASQAGNTYYPAAAAVSQSFSVKAAPSFTLSLASPKITLAQGAGTTDLLTVNPANGFNGTVSLTATGLPAGVDDAFSPSNSTSTNTQFVLYVTPAATPGSYTMALNGVSGSQTATTPLTLVVTGTQTITFNAIGAQPVGGTLTVNATATSGLPVTFTVVPNGNCSVSGNVVTFLNAGNCGVIASQSGNLYYSAAPQVGQIISVVSGPSTPVITWATPAPVAVGTKLSATQLDATASVAGTFAYTPALGTAMSTAGTSTLSVTFTPTNTTLYTTAKASVVLTVAGANATTINYSSTAQTIRGFGGSTAWMPQLTSNQANTLFGTDPGQLGLSILRVRIDPGGQGNWGTELGNAQEAQALGATIIASPWSPPASMTSNGTTIGGSLNTSSYASYASYLQSFANYMADNGVYVYAISMQNEPDAVVTYESCTWTGAQMDTWVANEGSLLTTKLMMPESESFITSYSDPALDDSAAVGSISIVAGHIYGTKPAYYTNAINKGKEVWMTEHYLSPSGAQPAIADALTAAKEISDSMEVADYNAYLWWWVRDWNAGSGVTNTGLLDANDNPTYYGLALGQFANFVRPGYVRASATYNPGSGNVYVTAYKGGHYVIVALNMGTAAVSQQFVVENQTIPSMTPYQTSATASITQLSAVTLAGNSFTYTLPAQSITTFVY